MFFLLLAWASDGTIQTLQIRFRRGNLKKLSFSMANRDYRQHTHTHTHTHTYHSNYGRPGPWDLWLTRSPGQQGHCTHDTLHKPTEAGSLQKQEASRAASHAAVLAMLRCARRCRLERGSSGPWIEALANCARGIQQLLNWTWLAPHVGPLASYMQTDSAPLLRVMYAASHATLLASRRQLVIPELHHSGTSRSRRFCSV